MLKILIVEDEMPSFLKLQRMLQEIEPQIEIVAHIDSVKELMQWLNDNQEPDLIFSDIELVDGQVFQVYQVYSPRCPIIFTSAHDNFLSDAFRTNGIDYLLKPYDKIRLRDALDKFKLLRARFRETAEQDHGTVAASGEYRKRFTIKRHQGIELLDTQNVALFNLDHAGLFAFDLKGKYYPLHDFALNLIEEQLDPSQFFRINRNQIISIHAIDVIKPYSKDKLQIKLLNLDHDCITSSHRTPVFRKWLDL